MKRRGLVGWPFAPTATTTERFSLERGELTVYADGQTYLWSQIKGGWIAVPDRSKR